MLTFPSVVAMMIVLPEEDGPNSLERSTLTVRRDPSTLNSTFFIMHSPLSRFSALDYNGLSVVRQGGRVVDPPLRLFIYPSELILFNEVLNDP